MKIKHTKKVYLFLILIAIVLLASGCTSSSYSNSNNNYTNYINVSNERITQEYIVGFGYYTPYYSAKVYNKTDKTIRVTLILNRYKDGFCQNHVLGGEITFLPKETKTFGRNLPYEGTYVAEWKVSVID